MKCPYLRNSPPRCIRMIEKGLDGKVSDFDMEHYCDCNPVNCYFYRISSSEKDEETLKGKLSLVLKR